MRADDDQNTGLPRNVAPSRFARAALLAALLLLVLPAVAFATTVDISGSSLIVDDGGPGTKVKPPKPPKPTPPGKAKEVNHISVSFHAASGSYFVSDTADIGTSDPLCVDLGATVTCPAAGITTIGVTSGKGNDSITVGSTPAPNVTLNGEDDDDLLVAADDVLGETLVGGRGNDLMFGGDGPDVFNGDRGFDTVSYADHVTGTGVVVTIGSAFNDGNAADAPGDSVLGSNERVVGSPGDDLLKGNGSANTLVGRLGDDRIKGKKGADILKGKGGIDVLLAKDGTRDVRINCGPGANALERAKRDKRLDPRPRSC
jgi:Ca2+-binding RTX toxin-like protein